MEKGYTSTESYASETLRADKDVVLSSVESYGQTLYFASTELRDDYKQEMVNAEQRDIQHKTDKGTYR